MAKVKIDRELCKGCGLCVRSCPRRLLVISKQINSMGFNTPVVTDITKCSGCASCAIVCPDCAIEIYKYDGRKTKVAFR